MPESKKVLHLQELYAYIFCISKGVRDNYSLFVLQISVFGFFRKFSDEIWEEPEKNPPLLLQ